jgi:mRNA interferase RelE/StbE
MKTIVFTHQAAKDLDAIEPAARETILTALAAYAIDGRGDVKRLSGRDGYRLRVGRYRVIFNEDSNTILAIYIGKRETTTYRKN